MKVSTDSKDSPIEGFEEKLKSEINQEHSNEITETVEFDVDIKEEPIESKDLKETEGILIKKESIESIETSVGYENELENFVDLYEVKSETKNILESNLEEDPLQIPSTNDTLEHDLRIKTSESIENKINIEPNSYESQLKKRPKVYIESVQKEKKPLLCNDCGARFFQKGHLNRHVKSVHSGIKTFKCNNCNSSFSQKENLNGHIKSVHEGKKPFKCNDCDSSFSRKLSLNRHIKTVHEEKKPIKCNVCEKVFSDKANLRVHIGSVHKAKTFKCNHCDSAFSRNAYLNVHIESVHEGKKPFKCNICDAAFSYKTNLKVHVESVHKGKKPFKCSECDAAFSQKVTLDRHVATIHVKFMLEFCNI